jgi:hypothetical protein
MEQPLKATAWLEASLSPALVIALTATVVAAETGLTPIASLLWPKIQLKGTRISTRGNRHKTATR